MRFNMLYLRLENVEPHIKEEALNWIDSLCKGLLLQVLVDRVIGILTELVLLM